MKSTIIDILNSILPANYFDFFSNIEDLLVIKEMGPHKFIIYIFLILFFLCYLIFKNKKLIIKKNYLTFVINKNTLPCIFILCLSLFFVYFSYNEYITNQYIFYESTTSEKKYNFFVYLTFFSFTNLIFYFFAKELTGSFLISFIATLLWVVSSIHISNLYPSLIRDYFKAALFLINFIFIVYFLKNKIDQRNLNIVWISLFFLCLSFIIRSDLKMLIPVYLYILTISLNYNFRNKIKILLIFFVINIFFTYITSSVYDGRVLQRFGASLSSEMYILDANYSVGPFEDGMFFYISCVFYECNMLKGFLYSYFHDLKLVFSKFFTVFYNIIFLPFRYGIIFEDTNILNKIILYKFKVLSQVYEYKFLYLLLLFTITVKHLYKKNYYLLNLLLIFLYMVCVYTLQNQIRHFFYLEGISLIILIFLLIQLFTNVERIIKTYVKKK